MASGKDLDRRQLAAGSVRRKLSAFCSLHEFLTDQNAVPVNPVKGAMRPDFKKRIRTYVSCVAPSLR
jgi:site-specific recombinase XerC